ncbi:MAG: hypothetical protein M1510_11315 [Nitrospirae bacterium]|nr:hypothetical protein [Nitrospirota bacterium]
MNKTLSKYAFYYPLYFLRGGVLSPKIKQLQTSQWYSPDELAHRQRILLKQKLSFIYENIPFYRRRFDKAGLHPLDIKSIEDISKIPVVEKRDIITHKKKFKFIGYSRKTSGSTGIMLQFHKDAEALTMMDAVMYRNYSWYDIEVGTPYARFWVRPLSRTGQIRTRGKDMLLNRITLSPHELYEEKYLRFLKQLDSFRPRYIYSYAQSIYQFSRYFYDMGQSLRYLNLDAVIVTSEMITAEQIGIIRMVFGCPVVIEYGCTEIGIIAMECPSGKMHIMSENLIVEFLKDGKPAGPGESGDIIVTELYGRLFPFIRYRLGDRGSLSGRMCECGRGIPLMESIQGRVTDYIVCPSGRLVEPYSFEYIFKETSHFWDYIRQYRIVQKSRDLLIIEWVPGSKTNRGLIPHLQTKIETSLEKGMQVVFKQVREIERDKSGKLRNFIREEDTNIL